ncbi:hypothetical protein [Pseudomonas phage D6]|nr:hypothetical protein [Pseudomonas phage D6]
MNNFTLYCVGRVATKVVIAAGFVAVAHAAAPYRAIDKEIVRLKDEWMKSTARQSINDRLAAGKLNRSQWLEQMHNSPARIMWVNLSTSFPDHRYIAKRIRAEYPHATRWI